MEKRVLLASVIDQLRTEIAGSEASLARVRQAAIEAPGAMQSKSDTTKAQLSSVANQMLKLITDKCRAVSHLVQFESQTGWEQCTTVIAGALVDVEIDGREGRRFLLLPDGGGMKVDDNGISVQVLTLAAPLAVELRGRGVGEGDQISLSGRQRTFRITRIV